MSAVKDDHSYGGPSDDGTEEEASSDQNLETTFVVEIETTDAQNHEQSPDCNEASHEVAIEEVNNSDIPEENELKSNSSEKESNTNEKDIALLQVDLVRKSTEVSQNTVTKSRFQSEDESVDSRTNKNKDIAEQHSSENGEESSTTKKKEEKEVYTCGICKKEFQAMGLLHDHMVNDEKVKGYKYNIEERTAHVDYGDNHKSPTNNQRKLRKRGRKRKEPGDDGDTDYKTKVGRKSKMRDDNTGTELKIEDKDLQEHSLVKFEKTMETKAEQSAFFDPVAHTYGTRRRSFLKLKEITSPEPKKTPQKKAQKKDVPVKSTPQTNKNVNATVGDTPNTLTVTIKMEAIDPDFETVEEELTENPENQKKNDTTDAQTGSETGKAEKRNTGKGRVEEIKPDGTVEMIEDNDNGESMEETGESDRESLIDEADEDDDYIPDDAYDDDDFKPGDHADKKRVDKGVVKRKYVKRVRPLIECTVCGKALRPCTMERHMTKHETKREFQCDICLKYYKSQTQCDDHKKKIHAYLNRFHKCKTCDKILKNKYNAEKHKYIHLLKGETPDIVVVDRNDEEITETPDADTNEDLKVGNDCHQESGDKDNLTEPEENEEGQEKEAEANGTRNEKNNTVRIKKRRHKKEKIHECEHCGLKFKKYYRLRDHIDSVHFNKSFECDVCKTVLTTFRGMWTHKARHLAKSDPFYTKEIAAKIQEEHKERMKPKEPPPTHVVCEICGIEVVTKRLVRHMESHNKSRDFKCDLCNKHFTTQRYVTDHKKKSHHNVTSKCDICGHTFKGTAYLEKHKQIHGPKDKLCSLCGKGFTTDFYLRTHMYTHASGKQFKCTLCEAGFKHKSRLDIHMVERHSKGLDKPCRHCGELFPSRQKARLHERKAHEGFLPVRPRRRHISPKKFNMEQNPVGYAFENDYGHITLKLDKETPESVEQIIEIPENSQQCQLMILPNGVIKVLNVIEGEGKGENTESQQDESITIQYVSEEETHVLEQGDPEVQYIEMDESQFKLMTEGKVHIVTADR